METISLVDQAQLGGGVVWVLLTDGTVAPDERPQFVPVRRLRDDDVQQIVETSAHRIIRLCAKRGLLDDVQADRLADEEPLLANPTTISSRTTSRCPRTP